jgi:hypothetical protein
VLNVALLEKPAAFVHFTVPIFQLICPFPSLFFSFGYSKLFGNFRPFVVVVSNLYIHLNLIAYPKVRPLFFAGF